MPRPGTPSTPTPESRGGPGPHLSHVVREFTCTSTGVGQAPPGTRGDRPSWTGPEHSSLYPTLPTFRTEVGPPSLLSEEIGFVVRTHTTTVPGSCVTHSTCVLHRADPNVGPTREQPTHWNPFNEPERHGQRGRHLTPTIVLGSAPATLLPQPRWFTTQPLTDTVTDAPQGRAPTSPVAAPSTFTVNE